MAELPPAVLDLIVNTAEWVSGLQEAVSSLQELNASILEASEMVADFSAAMESSAAEASAAMEEAAATITASADEAAASLDGLAASSDEASAAVSGGHGQLMLWATGALTAAGAAIQAAANFDTVTTRLVTSAGETKTGLVTIQQGLLAMAGQVGISATNLATAMYQVESAGFHAATGGLDVLKASAEGAAAEGADTTTVAKALTTVLNDYHIAASNAATVTSQMITAVSYGKTTLQTFSTAFANIMPITSAAGVSFQDTSAALAEMTDHGFTAQRASMALANAMRSMLNPTTVMKKAFTEYGVSTSELQQKLSGPNGLTDAMEYLSQAALKAGKEGTPQFAAALKALIGTAPGANAAMATVGSNFEATTKAIQGISGATADAQGNVKGFALVQETMNQKLADAKAALDSAAIQLGNMLMPALVSAMNALSGLTNILTKFIGYIDNNTWLKALAVGILAIVGAIKAWETATKILTAAQKALDVVLDADPIVLIALAIIGLVAAFVYLWTHSEAFRDFWIGLWNSIKAVVTPIASWINSNVIQPIVNWFHSLWPIIKPAFDAVVGGLKQAWDAISGFFKSHMSDIETVVKDGFNILWAADIKPTLDELVIGIKFAWDIVKDVFQTAGDIIKTIVHSISLEIQGFVNFIEGIVRLIYDIFTGNWRDAWGAAEQIVQGVVQGIEGIVGFVVGIGRDIVNGLIRGIESAAGALWSTIKNIGNAIVGTFKSVINSFSPSRKMADEVGQPITQGIAKGMLEAMPAIHSAIGTIGNTLTGIGGYGIPTSSLGVPTGVAGLAGGSSGSVVVINNNVAGTVVGETQLSDVVRQQILRYNLRNPTNGLSLFGRGST